MGKEEWEEKGILWYVGWRWDGKTIHPYKRKIDSFVEKQSLKYLNAYWIYKLQKYKKELIEWLVASKDPNSIFPPLGLVEGENW